MLDVGCEARAVCGGWSWMLDVNCHSYPRLATDVAGCRQLRYCTGHACSYACTQASCRGQLPMRAHVHVRRPVARAMDVKLTCCLIALPAH